MKNLLLAIALLPSLCCVSEEDATMAEVAETATGVAASSNLASVPGAQQKCALNINGTYLYDLPAELKERGVNLQISTAFANRRLTIDSAGMTLEALLDQVATGLGGRLSYADGVYLLDPIVTASASPVPQSVAADEQVLRGALDKGDIKRVIDTNLARVRACYDHALSDGKSQLSGTLKIHWVIEPDGAVGEAYVKRDRSTFTDQKTEACILTVVRSMVFPEPKGGGIVEVTYPFIFKAR